MCVFASVIAALCCVAAACAGSLPPYIHPCSASDPNLDRCIEKAIAIAGPKFADGIPELGVRPLDPVQLGTVNAHNPALKLVFTNTSVTGLKDFKVNSFKMNNEKGKAAFDFTSNVTLKGHYDMDGKILILPIKGNGLAKIKITNLNIVIRYDFDTKNDHWVVTSYKDSYKMDKANFHLSNLFGGNQQLATTVMAVINEHWEPVIRDIAPAVFQQVIDACVAEAKKLFAYVPASELLLP